MTIGQRAALAIRRKVHYGRVKPELDRLMIPQTTFNKWENGKNEPGGYWLAQLAMAGYDEHWILTGEMRYPAPDIDYDIAEHEEEE